MQNRRLSKRLSRTFIFEHGSAKARCFRTETPLAHIHYSGLITNDAMAHIGRRVIQFCEYSAVLLNFDKATTIWPYHLERTDMAPICLSRSGVFVVRSDQYDGALDHAKKLAAKHSVLRQVFLQDNYQLALDWAESLAAMESRRCQQRLGQ